MLLGFSGGAVSIRSRVFFCEESSSQRRAWYLPRSSCGISCAIIADTNRIDRIVMNDFFMFLCLKNNGTVLLRNAIMEKIKCYRTIDKFLVIIELPMFALTIYMPAFRSEMLIDMRFSPDCILVLSIVLTNCPTAL